jgi:hypothetical protein
MRPNDEKLQNHPMLRFFTSSHSVITFTHICMSQKIVDIISFFDIKMAKEPKSNFNHIMSAKI